MSAAHLRLERAVDAFPAFTRIYADERYAFLCESLGEAGRNRFSFFGGRPTRVHRSRPTAITVENAQTGDTWSDPRDLLDSVRALLAESEPVPDIAPSSGVVGYLGYDVVRRFERLPSAPPDPEGLPDSVLLVPSEIVVVDHHLGATDILVHGANGAERLAALRTMNRNSARVRRTHGLHSPGVREGRRVPGCPLHPRRSGKRYDVWPAG